MLCNRNFGIGADGIILILPPSNTGVAKMQIINSDGTIPEMCGNGIRCFIKYLDEYTSLNTTGELLIETLAGIIKASLNSKGDIKVNMGNPVFDPITIPTTLEVKQYDT